MITCTCSFVQLENPVDMCCMSGYVVIESFSDYNTVTVKCRLEEFFADITWKAKSTKLLSQ